jgi:hypothetical protein
MPVLFTLIQIQINWIQEVWKRRITVTYLRLTDLLPPRQQGFTSGLGSTVSSLQNPRQEHLSNKSDVPLL